MKKKHGSTDANTEDTIGRIPMSETLVQEEKPLAIMTSTQKTPWAEFLWANAHMKKIPDSYDANTEGPMGRIPMGETLVQEEKPLAIMTSTQKTPWAEFLWANAHMKKKTRPRWHQHGRLHEQKSLWAKRLHKKTIPDSYDVNTEDTMGRIPMDETLVQEEKPLAIMTSTQTPWAEFPMGERSHEENPWLL